MRKQFEKTYPIVNYLIWLCGLGVALGLMAFSGKSLSDSFSEQNMANTVITIMFFVITLFILVKSQKELNRGRKLTKAIDDLIYYIEGKNGKPEILNEILNEIDSILEYLQDESLKQAIRSFVDDTLAIRKDNPELCANIENYVNYDLIEADIKAHYQNQVSGTMTGLGILGTFLGLSIGLNSFNLSTQDAGKNEESIKALMEGIKVAFYTSIFGLIYSLLFSFAYRSQLVVFHNKIDELCTLFAKKIVPLSKNVSDESLISYQDKMLQIMGKQYELQRELLETQQKMNSNITTLSSNVGIGFTEVDQHLNRLSAEISTDVTGIMRDIVVPEMQQLSSVIEDFATRTADVQDKAMKEIVDDFISNMNSALGQSFDDLRAVLVETTEVQKNTNEQMVLVMDEVKSSVIDLTDINTALEGAILKIEKFTEAIDEMQDDVNGCINNLNVQIELSNENITTQTKALNEMIDAEKVMVGAVGDFTSNVETHITAISESESQILENMKAHNEALAKTTEGINDRAIEELTGFKDAVEAITKESENTLRNSYVNTVTELQKTISTVNDMEGQLSSDLSSATKAMVEATGKLNSGLEKRISNIFDEIDKDLADIMTRFSGTLLAMKETLNKTSGVIEFTYDDIENTFSEMHKNLEGYMASAAKLHRSMDSILNQVMQENAKKDN